MSPLADLANLQFAARAMPDIGRVPGKDQVMMYQGPAAAAAAVAVVATTWDGSEQS